MADTNTLVMVSAFSGLAGALLTQTLTGLFNYFGDRRKSRAESKSLFRNKQMEVAENFYFVTGETMASLKKSVEHWKNRTKLRSESSIDFSNKEIKKLDAYLEKLNTENWKQNLVGLYFNIKLSYNELIITNNKSHVLFVKLLDLADSIKNTPADDKNELYGQYHLTVFDLCSQYDYIYNMLEEDMNKVKKELLNSFSVNGYERL